MAGVRLPPGNDAPPNSGERTPFSEAFGLLVQEHVMGRQASEKVEAVPGGVLPARGTDAGDGQPGTTADRVRAGVHGMCALGRTGAACRALVRGRTPPQSVPAAAPG